MSGLELTYSPDVLRLPAHRAISVTCYTFLYFALFETKSV